MIEKSIPLNNGQRKEQIFVVTGCSWYLGEMEGMHVSGKGFFWGGTI